MSRARILLLIAALGVVAVVARLLFPGASQTERPQDQTSPPDIARVLPRDGVAATASPVPAPQSGADEALAAMRSEKALEVAASLRHKARFPRTSRRIEDNVDPIVRTRAVEERLSPLGQGRQPTLVVFSSSLSYEAPNPIIIFAKFIREYPGDWAPRADAEIAGELTNDADRVVAEIDLRDDGQDRDIEARDGVFTALLTPPTEDLEEWAGLIRVKVYGETAEGDRRSARTRFYYGAPAAKLTGYFQDKLVDGHLQILAEVEVTALGEFRLDATLSGSRGLLAWARKTVALEPGIGWIPLTFWGLTLREWNEPGPYRLSSVALANVSATPPQLNDAISTTYETAPYKPQDFSNDRYNEPKLLEKADRYEARARGEPARVP